MNFLRKLVQSAKYVFRGSQDRKYPDTYLGELEYQIERLGPLMSGLCLFMWLPYIVIDSKTHPEAPKLLFVRLGLSGIGIFSLLLVWSRPFRHWQIIGGSVLAFYIMAASGVAALLSGGDPAYIGGFFICLTSMAIFCPLPYNLLFGMLTIVYGLFGLGIVILDIAFKTPSQKYSLNDLGTVVIMTYVLGFIQHRIRKSNYTRAKEIERQKALIEVKEAESNHLLRNILPDEVADELRQKGAATPREYPSATVLFTDFVGFTRIAEHLTAVNLVGELDKCFSYFDNVAHKYGLEKLKTIGDAYMAAGGIPIENNTHPIDSALAALEIQAFMNQMKEIKEQQGLPYWELRLGMHTGPLVAGVVGEKKFAYDVWGDTVNTASRMESSGIPGAINISQELYDQLRFLFICEYRGKVYAKNKGEIQMYFLRGLKPKFSINGEGRVPNEEFKTIYERVKAGARLVKKPSRRTSETA